MPSEVEKQLDSLTKKSDAELRSLWAELTGSTTPPPVRRGLLIRAIAYRLQEKAFGAPSKSVRQRLRKLMDDTLGGTTSPARLTGSAAIKPGTRLIREWNGSTHEVAVIDRGFTYRGKRYSNLSEIARHITGTRRSGPLFFGLKESPATKRKEAIQPHGI